MGPSVRVLELTGNKSRAVAAARAAGLPVLASSAPSSSTEELVAAAEAMQFPLFVKAVAGGGGGVRDGSGRRGRPVGGRQLSTGLHAIELLEFGTPEPIAVEFCLGLSNVGRGGAVPLRDLP